MAAMSKADYVVRVGDREAPVSSAADLERHLADVRSSGYSDFWVVQRGSAMKGFEQFVYRALGLRSEADGPSVYVLTAPEGAAVVFLDEDFNEHRVVSSQHGRAGDVVFRLANGQETRHSADEVIDRSTALDAVRYFVEHGERPSSLNYRDARGGRRRRARN